MTDSPVSTDLPLTVLGGLTPRQFMRRHWQRKPLLVRQGLPGVTAPVDASTLAALAAREDVVSRLVQQRGRRWDVQHGPVPSLPDPQSRRWTLLVQNLQWMSPAARALLERFRFASDVRLDDLMISWAGDGGGVGPHVDSYDVFLIQVQGRRRWSIAPPGPSRWCAGQPLRILAQFTPTQSWVLEPGDLLYLPPGWGHDGVAVGGDCMTCSVGYRAPTAGEVATALVTRLADRVAEEMHERLVAGEPMPPGRSGEDDDAGAPLDHRYRDAGQPPTQAPAAIPMHLRAFAAQAFERAVSEVLLRAGRGHTTDELLGEWLSEPAAAAAFEPSSARWRIPPRGTLVPDAATRMLHDEQRLYVNGESWRMAGRDARLLRRLADARALPSAEVAQLSSQALEVVRDWQRDGWVHWDR